LLLYYIIICAHRATYDECVPLQCVLPDKLVHLKYITYIYNILHTHTHTHILYFILLYYIQFVCAQYNIIYDNEDGAAARASSAQVRLCSRGCCWSGRRPPTAACMCVCNNGDGPSRHIRARRAKRVRTRSAAICHTGRVE